MTHKLVDCRELFGEGQFGPVFYLRRDLVVRLAVEIAEKQKYLSRYAVTVILVRPSVWGTGISGGSERAEWMEEVEDLEEMEDKELVDRDLCRLR